MQTTTDVPGARPLRTANLRRGPPGSRGMARSFRHYVAGRNLPESDQLAFFPLFVHHRAIDLYDTLKPQDKTTIDELLGEFNRFF